MTTTTIKYSPLPQVCVDCCNQAIDDATRDPTQAYVSVHCPHHSALLTAQLATVLDKDRWVIAGWTVSGPLTEDEAISNLKEWAQFIGAIPAINPAREKYH